MTTYKVWSEREATSPWYACVYAAYLTAQVAAGHGRFPLGAFTTTERKAFEASQTIKPIGASGNFSAADQAARNRYGPGFVMHSATDLAALLARPGLVLAVAGLNSRLVTRLRHWQPSYTAGHAAAIVTLGPGLLWLDPLAPMGYLGEPISASELMTWWNKTAVRYLAIGELAVQTVTLTPFAPTRTAHFAGGRTYLGYDPISLARSGTVTVAAAGSSAACAGVGLITPAPAWAPDGKVWKIANGALMGRYVPVAGITVDPAPPPDCTAAIATRDLAWRAALGKVAP